MQTELLLLLIFVPIAAYFIWSSYKKRKNKDHGKKEGANNDEVWKTVKRFLREQNEIGQEVVDSFVAKRTGKDWKKRDIYVVTFTTRDSKTLVERNPRAIEVEVISKRISKKGFDRKVIINGEKDYSTEMEWITKVRKKELASLEKEKIKKEKKEKAKLAKLEKKKQAELIKNGNNQTISK